jgi:hypothetical protein
MRKNERSNHDELNGTVLSGVFRVRIFEGASILLYTYVSSEFQFHESINLYEKKQVVVII